MSRSPPRIEIDTSFFTLPPEVVQFLSFGFAGGLRT